MYSFPVCLFSSNLHQDREIYGKARPQDLPVEILTSANDHQHHLHLCHHVTAEKAPGSREQPTESGGRLLPFQPPASGVPAACLVFSERGG